MTTDTVLDQTTTGTTQVQAEERSTPLTVAERKRYLELAGVAAYAKSELDMTLDHIAWTLRLKDWGKHQLGVDRIVRATEELNAAIGDLRDELNTAYAAPAMA